MYDYLILLGPLAAMVFFSFHTSLNASKLIHHRTVLHKKSGVLYQTSTQPELEQLVTNGLSSDFSLVIPYSLLTRSNIDSLSATRKLTGLIVLLGNATNDNQLTSPDSSCPNCQFGLYTNDTDQFQWNIQAQNLIEESFDFPIFAIRPEDALSRSVYDSVIAVKEGKIRHGEQNS